MTRLSWFTVCACAALVFGAVGCGGSNNSDCLITLPIARVATAVRELLAETANRFPP